MSESLIEKFDLAQKAGELFMKGLTPIEISRQLEIPRREAELAIHNWKEILRKEAENSLEIKDKVMEVLFEVDEHWKMVVREAWNTVEQADSAGSLNTKTQTLKLIADINKSRAGTFQSAGAGYDSELIEEVNRTQRNQEVLVGILRETKDKFPEAAEFIARRLAEVTGEAEVLAVEKDG